MKSTRAAMELASIMIHLPAAIVEVWWRLKYGLMERSLIEIYAALVELRDHLKEMRKSLTKLDLHAFIGHYKQAVAVLNSLLPDLELKLPDEEVISAVFKSLSTYAKKHGRKPPDYYVIRYIISSALFPLLSETIRELLSVPMPLSALGQIIGEPYKEEKDEQRAYRWLMEHAGCRHRGALRVKPPRP